MAKPTKRTDQSFQKRTVYIVTGAFVLVVVGLFVYHYFFKPHPPGVSLAEKLREYDAEPAVGMAGLEPGAVLRLENMAFVAQPDEAFTDPTKLKVRWSSVQQSGIYTDSLKVEGSAEVDVLKFLGLTGLQNTLSANRVARVVTEIKKLQRGEISEAQIESAGLREEYAREASSGGGVVVVQTVFKVGSMSINLKDERGADVRASLPPADLPGAVKTKSEDEHGLAEEYKEAIIGYKAWFCGGGPGSDLTPETARELGERIRRRGIDAKVIGNRVVIPVTARTAPQLSSLYKNATERDRALRVSPTASTEVSMDMERRLLEQLPAQPVRKFKPTGPPIPHQN